MIASAEILRKTGIKAGRTLTRWYQQGLIPAPMIATHPNGRGKMAYWPEWVLDRCREIIALQKQGQSLDRIRSMLEMDRSDQFRATFVSGLEIGDNLKKEKVKLRDKREVTLEDFFISAIYNHVKRQIPAGDLLTTLADRMKKDDLISTTMVKLRQGYHPVLLFNHREIWVFPDAKVSLWISSCGEKAEPYIVVPLLAPIRQAFNLLGQPYPFRLIYTPASRVVREEKGSLIEYGVLTMGTRFKLDPSDTRVIGPDPDAAAFEDVVIGSAEPAREKTAPAYLQLTKARPDRGAARRRR